MLAYWRDGHDGASVNEIARAAGASKPTLYAAFGGGKDGLFAAAMRAYYERWGEAAEHALARPGSVREALWAWFEVSIDRFADASLPAGCLLVDAAMDCGRLDAASREAFAELADRSSTVVHDRLAAAGEKGELRCGPDDAMAFLSSQQAALAMLSAGGADRRTLEASARLAIDAVCVPAGSAT